MAPSSKMSPQLPHPTSSSRAPSTNSLASFEDFISTRVPPAITRYNQFATSYLVPYVQFPPIACDDTDSCPDIDWRFGNQEPTLQRRFVLQRKAREILGPSVRSPKLIPSANLVLEDFNNLRRSSSGLEIEDFLKILYTKAGQFCQVAKALDLDLRFPKPDPDAVRRTYSQVHQEALKKSRHRNPASAKPIFTSNDTFTKAEGQENILTAVSTDWAEKVTQVLGEPEVPEALQTVRHWQQQALKTSSVNPKQTKKRFWKKNVYPPMTLEDKIAAKRALLPPMKSQHLQTDLLSGVWIPELMVDDFEITPLNYDSRILPFDHEGPRAVPKVTVHEATRKCWKWLGSIPPGL